MKRLLRPITVVAALLVGDVACSGQAADVDAVTPSRPLEVRVVETIAGPDGGYDYVSVDPAGGRVYVARRDGVMTIDLASRRVAQLVAANDVSAVLPIPGTPWLLATVFGDDANLLLDRRSGEVQARLPGGDGPDAAIYDSASGLAFVMNAGSGDVTVIDPAQRRVVRTIAVGGKPESGAVDGRGHLYVNLEESAQIADIDIARGVVVRRLPLAGCVEPTGLAYDSATGLLISACHNGVAKLTDAASGRDRGGVPIGRDADGAIFDPQRRLGIVPADEGVLTVFELDRQGNVGRIVLVATAAGARTAALDPRTGQVFLPVGEFAVDARGERQFVTGSFRVIVVATQ